MLLKEGLIGNYINKNLNQNFLIFLLNFTNTYKVIDIYQDWCGPTKAMENIFRKVKMELADPLLHFATVYKLKEKKFKNIS